MSAVDFVTGGDGVSGWRMLRKYILDPLKRFLLGRSSSEA
jgi:hypothetical protein